MAADGAKSVIKRCLLRSRVMRVAGTCFPPSVVVLRYHSIREDPKLSQQYLSGIVHALDRFDEHMRIIASEYVPVSLDDIVGFAEGKAAIPRRAVAVTFDDGFADNLEIAAPVMNRYGIKGAVFVSVGFVEARDTLWFLRIRNAFNASTVPAWPGLQGDREYDFSLPVERYQAFLEASRACAQVTGERQESLVGSIEQRLGVPPLRPEQKIMLTWNDIRELQAQGHIIGSHTMSHPNVAHVGHEELVRELVDSKRRLEEKTQVSIIHFSFPKPILTPYFTEETIEEVRRAGYRTAVTCEPGTFRRSDDLFRINRFIVPHTGTELQWLLENAFLGRMA
jgi:peptidoglycan/xylan/chitin deacetylase (PgdA/CDA1 family)